MVANKLPATVLAQVFLLVIAGFAVSLYILPTATGTANGILSFHTSNIPCLRCFLFARRLSAYILGHHQKCIAYCEKNGILRREGDKVLYPPFANTENQPDPNIFAEKAKLFFNKFRQNKPAKRASLVTVCQNLHKLDNAQREGMIPYIVAQQKTPPQRNRRAHLAPITNQAGTLRCVSLSTESLIRPSDAPCLKLSGERLYF